LIFYETPHRIVKSLEDIKAVLGDVRVVIARELTKIHEEFLRGSAEELLAHFAEHPPRGEMVVLFNVRIRSSDNNQCKKMGGQDDRPLSTPT
jgi:16S rRNA (cytidine1402-2'-O)-methyltransferase